MKQDLSEAPIQLPQNPYWEVFKRFGRDEVIALVVNVIGTVLVSFFSNNALLISLTGPIVEKIGFFPMHIWEACKVYQTTPHRRNFTHYVYKAFKNGMTSLTEDILVHDPIYIILMMLGLSIYPGIPIWLLSTTSFVAAVVAVSGLEVAWKEFKYWQYKNKMKKAGFEVEIYYEARFYVKNKEDSSKLLDKFAKEFNLQVQPEPLVYYDTYFEHDLPEFPGRKGKVRLRNRTHEQGWIKTIQIVYTSTREKCVHKHDQYRFYPTKKEKIYYTLDKIPKSIKEIPKKLPINDKLPRKEIHFHRHIANDPELLVSTDKMNKDFYLVELKVRKDLTPLVEAMRFLMQEFPVVQTTHEKHTI